MLLLVLAQADHSWIERGLPRFPTIAASRHSRNAIVLPVLFRSARTLQSMQHLPRAPVGGGGSDARFCRALALACSGAVRL
jgi:hypothetical protein